MGTFKQRVMLGLALVAVAIGVTIAVSGGSGHHRRHGQRPAAAIKANEGRGPKSSGEGSSSGNGAGGTTAAGDTTADATPTRMVLAANYLGLTTRQLRARLKKGRSLAQIADATKGKSSAGLIDVILANSAARMRAAKVPASTQKVRLERARRRLDRQVSRVRGTPALEHDLLAASDYLGVSSGELHVLLQHGQTLAQVAESKSGRSAQGVTDAIVKDRRERLKAAVAAGLLTPAAEQAEVAALPGKIDAEIHKKQLQGSQPAKG